MHSCTLSAVVILTVEVFYYNLINTEKLHNYDCVDNQKAHSSPAVLYIWSGQDSSVPNASDFVAVVDFDENSDTYGHILKTVHLKSDEANGIAQQGNEPHHSAISLNGKYLVTGGLLSFLSGHKEVFVWRISQNDPRKGPEFLYALDVPGACTDEFLPISDTEFIVSMMCNENATSPGDMAFIDVETRVAKSYLKNASAIDGFNPHGFGRLDNGSIFTADYIQPVTLVGTDPSKILFRNTARHFLPDGTLEKTYQFHFPTEPGASSGVGTGIGFMELKCIPNDPLGRCYVCGTSENSIYLIAPGMNKGLLVCDLSQVNGYVKKLSAGLVSMFPNGKQMLMTFQMRYIVLMDISDPENVIIQQVFDFCTDPTLDNVTLKTHASNVTTTFSEFCKANANVTGTHWMIHPKGENRFIIVNYFLKFGMAQFEGTRTVHAFKFNKDFTSFSYDHRFNPNFQFDGDAGRVRPTFFSLQSYPHHVQYIKLKN